MWVEQVPGIASETKLWERVGLLESCCLYDEIWEFKILLPLLIDTQQITKRCPTDTSHERFLIHFFLVPASFCDDSASSSLTLRRTCGTASKNCKRVASAWFLTNDFGWDWQGWGIVWRESSITAQQECLFWKVRTDVTSLMDTHSDCFGKKTAGNWNFSWRGSSTHKHTHTHSGICSLILDFLLVFWIFMCKVIRSLHFSQSEKARCCDA